MDGIFIPKEILKLKELTSTEKMVLSLYKYYTEKGTNKCCSLTKPQIANELNISTDYMKKIKSHLVDLGYIRTVGKIKVIYLGVERGTILPSKESQVGTILPSVGYYTTQCGVTEYPSRGNIVPSNRVTEYPHKEEKKEKNIKKEEKKDVSNFDLILGRLSDDYKTQEKIDYMKEHFLERINQQDFSVGGVIDSWVTGIKTILLKQFPIENTNTEPLPKQRSNTIDVF